MNKFFKFIKSFVFVIFWLIITSYLDQYWNLFHWKQIYLKSRVIFDYEIWFLIKSYLFGFDFGYYLEEFFKFITFEIPKELFKFIPIYLFVKSIWNKK